MGYIMDDITDSCCRVEPVYDSSEENHNLHGNQTFLFDFDVIYTRVPEPDSDGEADYMSDNVETRFTHQLKEYGRDCFVGQDEEERKATVYAILYELAVPAYPGIVTTFTEEIESIMKSPLEKLKKIKVMIEVNAPMFLEDEMGVEESDVKSSMGGASVEAIEQHLEIFTVIDSDLVVGRMPCKHVFHRVCIEKWLEETRICPLCRDLFPV